MIISAEEGKAEYEISIDSMVNPYSAVSNAFFTVTYYSACNLESDSIPCDQIT